MEEWVAGGGAGAAAPPMCLSSPDPVGALPLRGRESPLRGTVLKPFGGSAVLAAHVPACIRCANDWLLHAPRVAQLLAALDVHLISRGMQRRGGDRQEQRHQKRGRLRRRVPAGHRRLVPCASSGGWDLEENKWVEENEMGRGRRRSIYGRCGSIEGEKNYPLLFSSYMQLAPR